MRPPKKNSKIAVSLLKKINKNNLKNSEKSKHRKNIEKSKDHRTENK